MTRRYAATTLLLLAAGLIAAASVAHASRYEAAMTRLSEESLSPALVASVQALWLGNSANLAVLALILAWAAFAKEPVARCVLFAVGLLPLSSAIVLAANLGIGIPAAFMGGAAFATIASAFLSRANTSSSA